MASSFLQPVDHASASRLELAGLGALVARLAQMRFLNHSPVRLRFPLELRQEAPERAVLFGRNAYRWPSR